MSEIHVPQYNKSLNVLPIAPIKKQINYISSHLYFDHLYVSHIQSDYFLCFPIESGRSHIVVI